MAGKHRSGWKRIGGDVRRLLQSLVTVEDVPGEAQRPRSVAINPATRLRMLGGIDTGGHTVGQGFTIRTQKR